MSFGIRTEELVPEQDDENVEPDETLDEEGRTGEEQAAINQEDDPPA